MSKNKYLFQTKSACVFLLVCMSFCPSVFASGYCLSSQHGFDSVASEVVEFNSASPSSNESLNLSLLTLLQVTPVTDQKMALGLNAAKACHTFKWESKTSNAISYASFVNGQDLTVMDILPSVEELLQFNAMWTMGQLSLFMNLSADQNAVSQNTFADKWMLHAIRIADSTTSGILTTGTGLL